MQCDEKICTESGLCERIPIVSGGLDAVCETFGSGVLINGKYENRAARREESVFVLILINQTPFNLWLPCSTKLLVALGRNHWW